MSVTRTDDLATCLELRRIVFTEEQGVSPDEEVDGRDPEAVHFLSTVDGKPVGTARVLVVEDIGKIGRVCVLKEARGTGQGQALVLAAVDWARGAGLSRVRLGAQLTALSFYEALGFTAHGEVFLDAEIKHRMMDLIL